MDTTPLTLEAALHALEAHQPGCVQRSLEGVTLQTGPPLPLSGGRAASGGMGLLSVVPAAVGALMLSLSRAPGVLLVGTSLLGLGVVLLWMEAHHLRETLHALRARLRDGYRGTLHALRLQPGRLTLWINTHEPPVVVPPQALDRLWAPRPGRLVLAGASGWRLEVSLPRADGVLTDGLLACLVAWRDAERARARDDARQAGAVQAALAPLRQRGVPERS